MRNRTIRSAYRLLPLAAVYALFTLPLRAQEYLIVTCGDQGGCSYLRVYMVTLLGKDTVRTIPVSAANDPRLLRKGNPVRLNSMYGVYNDPKSGLLHILARNGQLGNIILPSKMPSTVTTAASALQGATLEYREQAKSKTQVAVPVERLVALFSGPGLEGTAVEFIKKEIQASEPHRFQPGLIAGALAFASTSEELRAWRDELRKAMRQSLDLFKSEKVDPARLEATLVEGLAAMRIHRLVALEGQKEEALQEELSATHRRLLEQFAVAGALMKAQLHDPFLEKLDQIGLARWCRSDLAAGVGPSMRASAQWHYQRAKELFAAKQYGRAFDEARLASSRAGCDTVINDYYYQTRVEFVNKNMIQTSVDYEKEGRSILQQIVRELQGMGQESNMTAERIEYVHKRIAEGERLDKDYLPLQLKKAEFLANLGELTASREVVTRIERSVQLSRSTADEWLNMDAGLNGRLITLRQRTERLVAEQISSGQFKEAIATAAVGLKAEPANAKLLYLSAAAAAVQRDRQKMQHFVEQYLHLANPGCTESDEMTKTLFELYRRQTSQAGSTPPEGKIPNWVSGEFYRPGEVFYDPLSGGFQPHVILSAIEKGSSAVEFRWDGFMAVSITTIIGTRSGKPEGRDRTQLELEPVYSQKPIYMTGIGVKANSAGERRIMPLRYLNSPDFDPLLAAKFTGKVSTRGWSGNPFFHPFLWNDIFLFDLVYDELGRIKEAIPVAPDVSRPKSPFSESLRFTWDGNSKRLLQIKGAKYSRVMSYDSLGRLRSEKILYPTGNGKIEYTYQGKTMQIKLAKCEDNFYDKASRIITIESSDR